MNKLVGVMVLLVAILLAIWLGTRSGIASRDSSVESERPQASSFVPPGTDLVALEPESSTSTADRATVEPTIESKVVPDESAPREEPQLAEIRGRFLLPGGAPAIGVELEVHGWQSNQENVIKFGLPEHWEDPIGSSDQDGRFSIRLDPPQAFQFVLEAKLEGWCTANWRWSQIEPRAIVEVGDVELVQGGSIRGRVVDSNGKAVAGGWMVYGESTTPVKRSDPSGGRDSTDVRAPADESTGEFLLEDVPPGRIRLKAYSRIANWIEGPGVDVRAGEETQADITYTGPDNESRIVVKTFCRPFHVFSDDAEEILLSAPGQETRKASKIERSSQSFAFDDLPPGSYTVEIRDAIFQPWSKSGVRPGETVSANLKGSAAVALQVVDEVTVLPIERFALDVRFEQVNFHPNLFRVIEAKDALPPGGLIEGLIPKNQTLIVRADGYAPREIPLPDLQSGETRSVMARVGRGKSLVGRTVAGAAKKAVGGVRVVLLPARKPGERSSIILGERDPAARSTESDAEGRFSFTMLPPGSFHLRGRLGESLVVQQPVTIAEDDDSVDVELVLPAPTWLVGKLIGPPEASFEGLRILANPVQTEPGEEEARMDLRRPEVPVAKDGTFRCGPLPAGETRVILQLPEIELPGFGGSMSTEGMGRDLGTVTLAPEADTEREFDVRDLFPGSIRLRVRVNGAPAASALVEVVNADPGNVIATVQLDANGEGTSGPVFPGVHRLVSGPGDGTWIHLASVQPVVKSGVRVDVEFDIQLFRGTLHLIDAGSGKPLAASHIVLAPEEMREAPQTARVRTDDQGIVELSLPAGRFLIETGEMAGFFDPATSAVVDWTSSGPIPKELALKPSQFPR